MRGICPHNPSPGQRAEVHEMMKWLILSELFQNCPFMLQNRNLVD